MSDRARVFIKINPHSKPNTTMFKVNYSEVYNTINIYFEMRTRNVTTGVFEIVVSVFYVASFVVSVVGNVCTCAVIFRDRSMRTPTNYYLLNLAIADLATAMFLPIEIIALWIPDVMGKVAGHISLLFWDFLCNCSVLTILALTIERYIVISRPFLRHTFVLSSRVFKILAINWTIAASFCTLNMIYMYNIEDEMYIFIIFDPMLDNHIVFLMAVEILIFFIFPMLVITMLYCLITLKLKAKHSLSHSPNFAKQNRSKAIKMLAAIAASFFICWSPYCVLRIMAIARTLRGKEYINVWQTFCFLNGINSYASTAVNPILYSLMSRKFRRAFKELLNGRKAAGRKMSARTSVNTTQKKTLDNSLKLRNLQNKTEYRGNYTFD